LGIHRECDFELELAVFPDCLVLAWDCAFPLLQVEDAIGSTDGPGDEAKGMVFPPLLSLLVQPVLAKTHSDELCKVTMALMCGVSVSLSKKAESVLRKDGSGSWVGFISARVFLESHKAEYERNLTESTLRLLSPEPLLW